MSTTTDPALVRQCKDYLRLRAHWRGDPVTYVRQRFGAEPTWQQVQILEAIAPAGAKVSVRSGHGIGKSSSAAWAICWFLETHDFAKVPCTAPSSHRLKDVLWGELAKWLRAADTQSQARGDPAQLYLSALLTWSSDKLIDSGVPDWGAFARTAHKEQPEALSGYHATHLLYIVDEGSGVDEAIFAASEGSLSTPGARVLLLGNPLRLSGTFHASHHQDRASYTCLHFRSQDSPLVAVGYRDRLVKRWGEGSNVVRVRCDGEFPRQEDDVLISLELTEPCLHRERVAGTGKRQLGIDPARFGSDRTAFVLRQGRRIVQIAVYAKLDTMETVGRILAVVAPWHVDDIFIDTIGLGSGVYDRLKELCDQGRISCTLHAVNVAETAPEKEKADAAQGRKLRDFLWLRCATWLRDDSPIFGCPDDMLNLELAGELSSTKLRVDSDGLLVVESKDDMKRRLGHSPDLADALCCTFAPVVQPLGLIDMTRAFMGPVRRSPGPGPSTPRASFGPRLFAEDLEEETQEPPPGWDEAKVQAATGELRLGPRPERR